VRFKWIFKISGKLRKTIIKLWCISSKITICLAVFSWQPLRQFTLSHLTPIFNLEYETTNLPEYEGDSIVDPSESYPAILTHPRRRSMR